MKTTKTLFLACLDPISRFWFPISQLTFDQGIYQFVYTQGVKEAEEKSAFKPLSSFSRLDEIYTSTLRSARRGMSGTDRVRFFKVLTMPNAHSPKGRNY